jgi:hypothetical protein
MLAGRMALPSSERRSSPDAADTTPQLSLEVPGSARFLREHVEVKPVEHDGLRRHVQIEIEKAIEQPRLQRRSESLGMKRVAPA